MPSPVERLGQILAAPPARWPSRFLGVERGLAAVEQRRCLGREDDLGIVDRRAFERFELGTSSNCRSVTIGETGQHRHHRCCARIASNLRAQLLGVEPDRTLRGLAHLGAVGGGDQRGRQPNTSVPSIRRASSIPLTIFPTGRFRHLQTGSGAPRQL